MKIYKNRYEVDKLTTILNEVGISIGIVGTFVSLIAILSHDYFIVLFGLLLFLMLLYIVTVNFTIALYQKYDIIMSPYDKPKTIDNWRKQLE